MYEMPQKVLFKHCDPAGIVFFPRYFEMMNDCVEGWFADVLGWPFEDMHQTAGVPTANIQTRFSAPSRHGDQLVLRLVVTRIGKTSLAYEMTATCGEELRFATETTLVHINAQGRPAPWPASIRTKIEKDMKGQI
ncbi:acyl-CoA thioesterase [Tritonibacter mobilis]|uniref:acyl-CoA thioesterase n=1 Tax=Tritonibacter mobilis TaxID=379347 RepID=UPI001447DB3E|nr:acyl-CoA thioesterase [Rhodobacteraceae bacterium R_SAG5]